MDPDTGRVTVTLALSLDGRRLDGELELGARDVPLRNLRPTVMLPDGVSYLAGSSRSDGLALADPEDRGGVLVWRLGDAPAGWTGRLSFAATVDTIARADLVTDALLIADTPARTNLRAGPARATVSLVPEQVRRPTRRSCCGRASPRWPRTWTRPIWRGSTAWPPTWPAVRCWQCGSWGTPTARASRPAGATCTRTITPWAWPGPAPWPSAWP